VPHVALRLCREAREVDDAAHAVAALLRARGHRRACIIGHSYGSFVASRIVQLHPRLVHSVCMLDPVAMLTCYPQVRHSGQSMHSTQRQAAPAVGASPAAPAPAMSSAIAATCSSPCCLPSPVCTAGPLYCLQLLYNFVYKEPSAANFTSVLGALDLLRYICSRDQTIAQVRGCCCQ
jgi:pimeloyl-ACP methyl ester carboxylesterase